MKFLQCFDLYGDTWTDLCFKEFKYTKKILCAYNYLPYKWVNRILIVYMSHSKRQYCHLGVGLTPTSGNAEDLSQFTLVIALVVERHIKHQL